jgi:DNA-binding XRE family transcriptional regulator
MRQKEVAIKLGVSNRLLSLWETDRVYPVWAFQPRLIAYLDYDPFTDPKLGCPKGNEPSGVAFLSPNAPVTVGQRIKEFRLKSRKTRKQLAAELGRQHRIPTIACPLSDTELPRQYALGSLSLKVNWITPFADVGCGARIRAAG